MASLNRKMKALADFMEVRAGSKAVTGGMAFSVDASDLKKLAKVFKQLTFQERHDVMRRALNRAGDKAHLEIARAIATEGGFKVGAAKRNMRKIRATGGSRKNSAKWFGGSSGALTYEITARHEKIKVDSANFARVRWKRQWEGARWSSGSDAGSFMIFSKKKANRGVVVERKGAERLPLETKMVTGPAVLMGKVNALGIAQGEINRILVPRMHEEFRHITKKYRSKY